MDFIFILQIMKRKDDIADVAAYKEIWRADGFTQFGLVEAIYKLKIPGFSSEFLQMKKIAQRDADKQMQISGKRKIAARGRQIDVQALLRKGRASNSRQNRLRAP